MCIRDRINTDKNVKGSEEFIESSKSSIDAQLERYKEMITRVEVHFSDEDGNKDGINSKRCMICLLYTSDAADERSSVDLGGRRIIKTKKKIQKKKNKKHE